MPAVVNIKLTDLLTEVQTLLQGHTWPAALGAVHVYIGIKKSVADAGTVIMVEPGNQTGESELAPGNSALQYRVVTLIGAIPWVEPESDQDTLNQVTLFDEIKDLIGGNRQLGGANPMTYDESSFPQLTMNGPNPLGADHPAITSYRAVYVPIRFKVRNRV